MNDLRSFTNAVFIQNPCKDSQFKAILFAHIVNQLKTRPLERNERILLPLTTNSSLKIDYRLEIWKWMRDFYGITLVTKISINKSRISVVRIVQFNRHNLWYIVVGYKPEFVCGKICFSNSCCGWWQGCQVTLLLLYVASFRSLFFTYSDWFSIYNCIFANFSTISFKHFRFISFKALFWMAVSV